jgi:hypothetical protein
MPSENTETPQFIPLALLKIISHNHKLFYKRKYPELTHYFLYVHFQFMIQ